VLGDLNPSDDAVQVVDMEDIPFPAATFDMVIANHMLEHIEHLDRALGEVHRVLKPGGRFVCQTPYASRLSRTIDEPQLQSEEDRIYFFGQRDHVRLFGLDIETILINAGFAGRLVPHSEILWDIDAEAAGVNELEPFFDFVRR
jgi:SAM-dependent methyltransferase